MADKLPSPGGTTYELSPLDQVVPRYYTRMLLCFRRSPDSDNGLTIAALKAGLALTVSELPILAGEVVPKDETGGRLEVRVPQAAQKSTVELVVKDLTTSSDVSIGTYEDLEKGNFSPSQLDGDILAPVGAMPIPGTPVKVVAAQVTFIPGGMLLCLCVHHTLADGNGVSAILRAWAQHCCRLGTTSVKDHGPVLDPATLDRGPLVNGASTTPSKAHPEYHTPDVVASLPSIPPSLPSMEAKVFGFSSSSMAILKANVTPKEHEIAGQISHNDALSAFLWSSITSARMPRLDIDSSGSPQSMLGMAVNGRSRFRPPLSDDYIGNVTLYSTTTAPVTELVALSPSSLSNLALSVRKSVNEVDDAHIRSVLSFLGASPDISLVQPGFKSFLGKDLAITSWANQQIYSLDWGSSVSGVLEHVRIPKAAFDGLCIILPKKPDGMVEVLIGLRIEDMQDLVKDLRFMTFATVRCE